MLLRKKGLLIISLSLASVVFLSSAVFAADFQLGRKFTDHTYVGPFNISNSKTKQAKSKLATDFSELQSKVEVNLIFQDIQFTLPPEIIKFDIDMTLANANSGDENPIIATVSREGLGTVLNQELPRMQFPEDAIDAIADGIEKELQSGIMPRNVYITDYLGTNVITNEIVASSEFTIDGLSPALSKAIHALDNTVILPFESFSMMELLMSPEIGPLSDAEMTFLSSIMYRAILQTNFQINERNISTVLTSTIQPGFEAAMNQTLGLDFKFTNMNKTEFTIRAAWSSGAISLVIEGKPFYYNYEPTITNIETYEPRVIRQYSAFVHDGQIVVSQEGEQGIEAVVKRTLSVDGQVVETEDVSEDFYAPINRIEIHPLSKSDSSPTNSTTEKTDLTQNVEPHKDTEVETSGPEEVESDNSGSNEVSGNKRELKEEEVIYDKSGLPVSGK